MGAERADYLVREQLAITGQRGERRSELVRDRCEERPLRVACGLSFLEESCLHEHDGGVVGNGSEPMTVARREGRAVITTPRAEEDRLIRGNERRDGDLADVRIGGEDRPRERWVIVLDDEIATPEGIPGE